MPSLTELTKRIVVLGNAEYRYDRLTADFAEHYLALQATGYEHLPDVAILLDWLRQLHHHIQPALLAAWQEVAGHYGFALGDKISVERPRRAAVEVYAARISCYPGENIVRVEGFGVKKDGGAGKTATYAELVARTTVTRDGRRLDPVLLASVHFETSSRQADVKAFIEKARQATG